MRIIVNCLGEIMLVIGMMGNALERERLVLQRRAFLPEHTLDDHADCFIHPIRFCPLKPFSFSLFFPSVLEFLCWCFWHLPWNSSFPHLWAEMRERARDKPKPEGMRDPQKVRRSPGVPAISLNNSLNNRCCICVSVPLVSVCEFDKHVPGRASVICSWASSVV